VSFDFQSKLSKDKTPFALPKNSDLRDFSKTTSGYPPQSGGGVRGFCVKTTGALSNKGVFSASLPGV